VLQLQLCVIYLTTGLHKVLGDMWLDGSALFYVLNDVSTTRWSFASLPLPYALTRVMTYGALGFELTFPLSVLWSRARTFTLAAGVLFHLGIHAMLQVGWFSFYMLALYVAWVDAGVWRRLLARLVPRQRSAAPGLRSAVYRRESEAR
jgi:hypothetical protein